VKGSGICGSIQIADPLDACHKLTKEAPKVHGHVLPFALLIRGNCTFDHKVKNAQDAGYKAAIVYDNEDDGSLVSSNLFLSFYFFFFWGGGMNCTCVLQSECAALS
jgi:E3 ubiquitin-protein ligase RNF13